MVTEYDLNGRWSNFLSKDTSSSFLHPRFEEEGKRESTRGERKGNSVFVCARVRRIVSLIRTTSRLDKRTREGKWHCPVNKTAMNKRLLLSLILGLGMSSLVCTELACRSFQIVNAQIHINAYVRIMRDNILCSFNRVLDNSLVYFRVFRTLLNASFIKENH